MEERGATPSMWVNPMFERCNRCALSGDANCATLVYDHVLIFPARRDEEIIWYRWKDVQVSMLRIAFRFVVTSTRGACTEDDAPCHAMGESVDLVDYSECNDCSPAEIE